MRWGLKTKFIIYLIPLVVFLCFLFLGFFINRANILIKKQLTEKGFSLVKSLSYSSETGLASGDPTYLRPYADRIFQEKDVVFLAIYDKEGRVLIANEKTSTEEAMPESLVGEILSRKQTVQKESQTKQGQKFYDFYSPIFIGEILTIQEPQKKEVGGFARVGLSLESIAAQTRMIVLVGLGITFLISILGILIAVFVAGRLLRPIKQLEEGIQVFAKGDLSYRIKIKTGDEIEDLSNSFNKMAQALGQSKKALEESKDVLEIKVQARTRELQELAGGLEQKVKDRTKELQERVSELERFHRLTVGRELKMLELKKALRESREKISQLEQKSKRKGRIVRS